MNYKGLNSYSTKEEAVLHEIVEPIERGGTVKSAANEYDIEAIFEETVRFDSDIQRFRPIGNPSWFWASVDRHAK
jgi:ribosomal protein S12 methylthiotransferase accessory factor YcaO